MNIIDLISSVEDILIEGQLPVVKTKTLVNLDEILDMLDEMKRQLPQELQAANHLRAEKNKLIIEAQQEAQQLLEDVAKEAEKMVNESDITKNAYIKSKKILTQAQKEVEELKLGTFDYLSSKMDEISDKLMDINQEMAISRNEMYEYLMAQVDETTTGTNNPQLMNETENVIKQLKESAYDFLSHQMDVLEAKNVHICEELAQSKAELVDLADELRGEEE